MPRWLKWSLISVVALAVLIVGGTWFWIHVIEGPPPKPLTFRGRDATTTTASSATGASSTVASSTAAASTAAATGSSLAGTWGINPDSLVGYRVKETLFGQSTEAVGRTSAITGQLTVDGTGVQAASFTVDLTRVTSDQSQRDSAFRGRIMNVSQFPTATFTLTSPLAISAEPADKQELTFKAAGDLMLHGVTKSVTFDLTARRNAANIEVNGTIPVTFADYGIDNPSGGPATTGDTGVVEFLLVFSR